MPQTTHEKIAKAKAKKAAANPFSEPKYPGDTILCQDFKRGDEYGSVRVQWYNDRSYCVGTFLPGNYVELPGDTPKVEPEKSSFRRGPGQAFAEFKRFCHRALKDDWEEFVWPRH